LIAELGEKTPLLLFAGRYGRIGSGEFQAFLENDPVLSRFARVVDAPADQALAWLYGNCLFSAYPSHVEGWGLPVGESAWFGKLCLASKTSSVPEVCGALMDYVDPTDVADIVRAARQLIGDRDYLQQREQAIRQAPLRRWADVADDLYGFMQAG
jgi:glycosyltransferase involved in cell wall biosynthesis